MAQDDMLAGLGPLSNQPFGLAVFDLDGTLLRGPTVCEVLARTLGRLDRMRQLEVLIAGLSDVDYFVGIRLEPDGTIIHLWPRDKVT